MQILTREGKYESRAADPRLPFGDSTPPPPGAAGGSIAGLSVTEGTALQVAAVYGSVSVLADSLSSLPVDLMSTPHRRTGAVLEPSPLVRQPYAEISLIDWWVQFVMSLALRGNFYGQVISRDADFFPTQIKPIHPDHASVRRSPTSGQIEYRFHGRIVPTANVFHVRLLSVAESLVGLNPIEYLRNILGLARAADMYGAAVIGNGAVPVGTIEVPEDLDPDETKAMKDGWLQMLQGVNRAGLPAVLTGGAKFNPITIKLEDLQFLQSRQYDASVICGQIFRVPPHMIGIVDRTTSWGTGIEQQELQFVRNTLVGYLTRGERALTDVHPPGQFVKFDLRERLRSDTLQRYQAHSLGIAGGFVLPDEARAQEDMPPLPDGIGQMALAPINAQTLKAMVDESIAAAKEQQLPLGDQNGHGNPDNVAPVSK